MNEKIENLLKEERKFPPSKELTENAGIKNQQKF